MKCWRVVFFMSLLLSGCIRIPRISNPVTPTPPQQSTVGIRVSAVSMRTVRTGDLLTSSELYLAYGARKNAGFTDSGTLPPSAALKIRRGEQMEQQMVIYEGRLNPGEILAINIVGMEEDCATLDKLAFSEGLIPEDADFIPQDETTVVANSVVINPVWVPYVAGLIRSLTVTTSLINRLCALDRDDLIGTVFMQFRRDPDGIRVATECRNDCQIINQRRDAPLVSFTGKGEHHVAFSIERIELLN